MGKNTDRNVKDHNGSHGGNMEKELPGALISWYPFGENAKTLFVSGGFAEFEVIPDILKEKQVDVSVADAGHMDKMAGVYDYIITAGTVEKSEEPVWLLARMKELLKENGKLLIGANNRLAVRHFCGDKDYFTGHVLDGIDNYRFLSEQRKRVVGGISYALAEWKDFLTKAGFAYFRFYAVLPELMRPQILLSEGCIPNEPLDVRVFPQYNDPSTLFLEEELLYPTLFANGMFYPMANGFFIECSVLEEPERIDQITVQGDRSHDEAMATLIMKEKAVLKRPLYPAGAYKIKKLLDNLKYLEGHGVPMVQAWEEKGSFRMPYQNEKIATEYFRNLLRTDRDKFIHKLGEFRNIIMCSSEHIPYNEVNWRQFEPGWRFRKEDDPNIDKWEKLANGSDDDREDIGVILERGYLDMVSLNCFASDRGFCFFDQEFYVEHFPVNAIFIRTIDFIYRGCPEMERLCPKETLLERFRLKRHENVWRVMGEEFLSELRNERYLVEYHRAHRREYQTIAANRHRMDYPQEEYDRLFTNIFKNAGSRKLYLFGSGSFAERFMEQFSDHYKIAAVLDNNRERWGGSLNGISIMSPAVLTKEKEPYKVFVCIKYFEDVLVQLRKMNVRDIAVYDPKLEYEIPVNFHTAMQERNAKPYHTGYVAGVFDLFHIGHLNLLRRAKEQCDHLIVGVVSDEQVIENKKTRPYVPFKERLAIVQSCRYVDAAVEIPPDRRSTQDAFKMYHFDAQFSGNDYENDPAWIDARKYLQMHGADLIFFPYTESVSSTQIKKEISHVL